MKYGLALGSGGARGFAHLGALSVLEETGFKPDIISGTSIGALVGALYSKGLTPHDIFNLKKDFNIRKILISGTSIKPAINELHARLINKELLNLKKNYEKIKTRINNPINPSLMPRNRLNNALKPYLNNIKFNELKTKFLAIATNLRTGKETIFKKGLVIDAVCASCSIPGIFSPVKIKNEIYADGALSSPVPVNALIKEGANKIISINLMHYDPLTKPENLGIINRAAGIMIENLSENQNKNADLTINIPAYNYKILSNTQATELFKLGEKTTRKHIREIKKLIK